MKEFDFEQSIRKTIQELKQELARYKARYTSEFKTIEETKQKPAELHQVRKILTTPEEYVLIYDIEDTGLVHAVPLTSFVNLTPSNLRIYIKDLTLAPLPYFVYVVREALEKISLPIAIVKEETAQKVVEEVEKTPHTSNIRPINEFIKLVWKRYEQLTIASLLYNAIKREGLDN
jgi:adenine C2-methylase RlmN of 23S rRNA A2503 and tRNA A37